MASLSAPGVPAITYNPDTAGRVASIIASSGQNPVSAVSYFPSQQVKTVTFGSGDYDTYALDANLRLSSYTLDINGSNDTGTLVWNGNNTLRSLAISDPFAAGDTQTCSYAQDDLGRLASAKCGSEWAQTYTPDSFGNQFTLSGGSSPLVASFNGNNQFSSVSGFVPNYNLDGDLLDNPLGGGVRNAYAWDAEGHAVTVEGVAQTFDALGRLVQNGQTGEVLWTPAGAKLGTMSGQSAGQEAVALPGHGAAVYAGGALSFYAHADWQGSWRLASTPSRTFDGDEAYGPYGATYAGTGPAAFTGKQVDTPDGLYDFPFRLSSPGLKRWLSPDPAGLAAVNPADPQSWDAYVYAGNQPLANVDPLGLMPQRPTYECSGDASAYDFMCGGDPGTQGGGEMDGTAQFGDDVFDALNGAPGTWFGLSASGNFTWGFSIGKWWSDEMQAEGAAMGAGAPGQPGSPPCSQSAVITSATDKEFADLDATFTDLSSFEQGGHENVVFQVSGSGAASVMHDIRSAPGYLGLPFFPTGLRNGTFDSAHFEIYGGSSSKQIRVHIDIANGNSLAGGPVHWVIDVGLGSLLGGNTLDACKGQ